MFGVFVVSSVSLMLFISEAVAAELPGPVRADVLRVVDGDTILVMAEHWPTVFSRVSIRIGGIDAPEVRRAACDLERAQGEEATAFLRRLLGVETDDAGLPSIGVPQITLRNVRPGKYQGRMVAEVFTASGVNVGAALLAAGLAEPWDGTGARPEWCE